MAGVTLDLGDGHLLRWVRFDPDLELNPQYAHLRDQLPALRFAATVVHPRLDNGRPCASGITFDTPLAREVDPGPLWQVQSWDPLTVSPSLLCRRCGDHGFIREGRWVRA